MQKEYMLVSDAERFASKEWKNQDNKRILTMILPNQIDIAPCTLFTLDNLGLNSTEIMQVVPCIGKDLQTLSVLDQKNLIAIQKKHKVIFNYSVTPFKWISYDNVGCGVLAEVVSGLNDCYEYPMRSSALFNFGLYK